MPAEDYDLEYIYHDADGPIHGFCALWRTLAAANGEDYEDRSGLEK